MKKIFFSYTLKDNIDIEFFENLRNWINKHNAICYIDLLDNEYNKQNFQDKLVQILNDSDIFCIIESINYYESKWTQIEVKIAKTNNIKIVKTTIDKLLEAIMNNDDIEDIFV